MQEQTKKNVCTFFSTHMWRRGLCVQECTRSSSNNFRLGRSNTFFSRDGEGRPKYCSIGWNSKILGWTPCAPSKWKWMLLACFRHLAKQVPVFCNGTVSPGWSNGILPTPKSVPWQSHFSIFAKSSPFPPCWESQKLSVSHEGHGNRATCISCVCCSDWHSRTIDHPSRKWTPVRF